MRLFRSITAFAAACSLSGVLAAPSTLTEKRAEQYTKRLNIGARDPGSSTKYFHEPGGDDVLGHYDIRYFKKVVAYDVRTDTLKHLMRSYLEFFNERGLETWIAHGTLLGWWWNGQLLPWDWDIDTQVSAETLTYLGKHLNRTMHTYTSSDGQVTREYLLDVNPWSWQRVRGDGMNIIDARWIDVRNGLYIDITGLSEIHPESEPGVWECKNHHKYHTKDLYPMRDSVYEGVPAKIPYSYDKILMEEYNQKALVLTEYQGHTWNQEERLWKPKNQNIVTGGHSKRSELEPAPVNNPRKRSWMAETWAF